MHIPLNSTGDKGLEDAFHRKVKLRLCTKHSFAPWYVLREWSTDKASETLNSFERKVLTRIYGSINDDGIWRIRHNHELYQLYKESPLDGTRTTNAGVTKKVFMKQPGEKKETVGRPRAKWADNVTWEMLRKHRGWGAGSVSRKSERMMAKHRGGSIWAVAPIVNNYLRH